MQSCAAKEPPELDDMDNSSSFFSMCLKRAEEEDEKRANLWMANSDRVLVFVSAHVAYEYFMMITKHRLGYSPLLSRRC